MQGGTIAEQERGRGFRGLPLTINPPREDTGGNNSRAKARTGFGVSSVINLLNRENTKPSKSEAGRSGITPDNKSPKGGCRGEQ